MAPLCPHKLHKYTQFRIIFHAIHMSAYYYYFIFWTRKLFHLRRRPHETSALFYCWELFCCSTSQFSARETFLQKYALWHFSPLGKIIRNNKDCIKAFKLKFTPHLWENRMENFEMCKCTTSDYFNTLLLHLLFALGTYPDNKFIETYFSKPLQCFFSILFQ